MNLSAEALALLARAGEAGISMPEAVEALRSDLPADLLLRTKTRMERAKRSCDDPARRVVQDTFSKLATRGLIESTGEGESRRYRLKPETAAVIPRPKPRRETVPLEQLTFDRDCQQRAEGLFDETTVSRYVELLEDQTDFPPIEAVWDGKHATYFVFDGFQRGEAYRRAKRNSIEVLIYDGSKKDAILYSLAANARHGKTRTPADCQRAISTVLGDKELRRRVLESAKDQGGVHRALALACGVSKGVVYKALKVRGLEATRTGGLRDVEKSDAKPVPNSTTPSGRTDPSDNKTPVQSSRTPAKPEPSKPLPARAGSSSNEQPESKPEPDEDDDEPHTPTPNYVHAALDSADTFRQLAYHLKSALSLLDTASTGPGCTFLRKAVNADGSGVVTIGKVRRGSVSSEVFTAPALVGLLRMVRHATPERVCAGCGGTGCICCHDSGFIPAGLELLPKQGEQGDLFNTEDLKDLWD